MDALRAEFPGATSALAPLRLVSVARAGPLRAFVVGIGAAFLVRAIAQIVLAVLYPLVLPATAPRPEWLTQALLSNAAGEIAAGLVLVRTGGLAALGLYALLELVIILVALPGRLLLCAHGGFGLLNIPCDLPAMLTARWPLWLALVAGALASGVLRRRADGEDRLLTAAGAFSLVITLFTSLSTLAFSTTGATGAELTFIGLYAVAQIVAGLLAGALLWRGAFARPLLLALCLAGPALALALPIVRLNLEHQPTNPQPLAYYLSVLASVVVPIGGAIAVFAGRALRREWGALF